MYDFSTLTPEQAAMNIRSAIATFFTGTKRDHALMEASLEMCGLSEPELEPSSNGSGPASGLG